MKKSIVLILSVLIVLLSSCASVEKTYSHNYKDGYVEASLIQYGDKVEITVKNISNRPIYINIAESFATLEGTGSSRLITQKQAESESSKIIQTPIYLKKGEIHKDFYVAIDAINFTFFSDKHYEIKDWIDENSVNVKVQYTVGNEKRYIIFY